MESSEIHTEKVGHLPLELHRKIEDESETKNKTKKQSDDQKHSTPGNTVIKIENGVILHRNIEDDDPKISERGLNRKLKLSSDPHSSTFDHAKGNIKSHFKKDADKNAKAHHDSNDRNKPKLEAPNKNAIQNQTKKQIQGDEEDEPPITMEDIKRVKAPNMFERIHEEMEAIGGAIKDKLMNRHKK